MLLAVVLLVLAHWANGQPAASGTMVIEVAFAILLVAMLDHGRTEPVAQGLSWLFFIAVILSRNSVLGALQRFRGTGAGTISPSKVKAL